MDDSDSFLTTLCHKFLIFKHGNISYLFQISVKIHVEFQEFRKSRTPKENDLNENVMIPARRRLESERVMNHEKNRFYNAHVYSISIYSNCYFTITGCSLSKSYLLFVSCM